jgi:hypothetical protein
MLLHTANARLQVCLPAAGRLTLLAALHHTLHNRLDGCRGSILGMVGLGGDGLKTMIAQGGRLLGSVVFRGSALAGEEDEGSDVIWFTGGGQGFGS